MTLGQDLLQCRFVILWSVDTCEYLRTLLSHTWAVYSLLFSEDSGLLASGNGDSTAIVWDVARGDILRVLNPHSNRVIALSEDLTARTPNDIFVWWLESGELLEQREERDTSVDDARIVGTSDDKFELWIGGGRRIYMTFTGDRRLSFTVRGDRVICICASSQVLILDISGVKAEFMSANEFLLSNFSSLILCLPLRPFLPGFPVGFGSGRIQHSL
jgi:WD40 repeat protein